jgi:hypothetical protein
MRRCVLISADCGTTSTVDKNAAVVDAKPVGEEDDDASGIAFDDV